MCVCVGGGGGGGEGEEENINKEEKGGVKEGEEWMTVRRI